MIAHDTLLATCGGDAEILASIVAGLLARLPRDLGALRAAIDDADLVRVRDAAHKLYGMVAAFSTLAGDETSALEEQAARGESASLMPTFARLERILADLARELPGITIANLETRTGSL